MATPLELSTRRGPDPQVRPIAGPLLVPVPTVSGLSGVTPVEDG